MNFFGHCIMRSYGRFQGFGRCSKEGRVLIVQKLYKMGQVTKKRIAIQQSRHAYKR